MRNRNCYDHFTIILELTRNVHGCAFSKNKAAYWLQYISVVGTVQNGRRLESNVQ